MKDNPEVLQLKLDGVATQVLAKNHPQPNDLAASNHRLWWMQVFKALGTTLNMASLEENLWAIIRDFRVKKQEISWKISRNR